ncbi:uncharacterized protein RCC_02095 [Ramularia collo-cygni]|uniref:Mediator complex subunit 11 n=1 Tax=Ramularia collo-cygni TaxID=112498 RepID=A0A2D3V7C3_9PEZI|nr:uncharacterized protein RCC_02095 [Ramularia collo-cygni]CZT16253.1 uncharacterized protein RCC_02095 [Ramularia collo-cygni]
MADEAAGEAKPWDAAQYEVALGHLARLQEQIDGLRATIPSIVSPLASTASDKATLFAATKDAALQSTSRLHTFRDDWNSQEIQNLFKEGKESLQKDTDLSKAGDVPKWGWGEVKDEQT